MISNAVVGRPLVTVRDILLFKLVSGNQRANMHEATAGGGALS